MRDMKAKKPKLVTEDDSVVGGRTGIRNCKDYRLMGNTVAKSGLGTA